MHLSPEFYHSLVRPKFITKKYIQNNIQQHFDLKNRKVLDFGSGTGANCTLCSHTHYFGIDTDSRRINFAKRIYPNYNFQSFTGNTLPLEDKSFDFILIVAVLHHIPPSDITFYIKEFKRILKKHGKVIVMEPCFSEKSFICNWFMRWNDKGDYIQSEGNYLDYFSKENFQCSVLKRFKKCFFYNELFFTAML